MASRREQRRQHKALEWLVGVAVSAQEQIDLGDLDFDDVLYRGRDAALTLLDIFDGRARALDEETNDGNH